MTEPEDVLKVVVDAFWQKNEPLRDMILRDVYALGQVTEGTNEAARIAVNEWLSGSPVTE